jgi:hypothetical protein
MSDQTIQIGNVAAVRDWPQSKDGDFSWPLEFYDGEGTTDPTDLTGSLFSLIVYDLDGVTPLITKTQGAGIVIAGNVATATILKELFAPLLAGCKYPYKYNWTKPGGFRKPLFRGQFLMQ